MLSPRWATLDLHDPGLRRPPSLAATGRRPAAAVLAARMPDLPALSLSLHDAIGAVFGVLRLAPREGEVRGECIFDIAPRTEVQGARSEVRWLAKRSYRARGEHRFKLAENGSLTVSSGDFRVVFETGPTGEPLRSKSPAPPVSAAWVVE